jgi:hypothetical protein
VGFDATHLSINALQYSGERSKVASAPNIIPALHTWFQLFSARKNHACLSFSEARSPFSYIAVPIMLRERRDKRP